MEGTLGFGYMLEWASGPIDVGVFNTFADKSGAYNTEESTCASLRRFRTYVGYCCQTNSALLPIDARACEVALLVVPWAEL